MEEELVHSLSFQLELFVKRLGNFWLVAEGLIQLFNKRVSGQDSQLTATLTQ